MCRANNAPLSPWDRGILFGQGIFETLRSWSGVPFLVEEHEKRLLRSAQALDLPAPTWKPYHSLRSLLHTLVRKNRLPEAYLRVMLTAGRSDSSAEHSATVCILVRSLHPYDDKLYTHGANVIISSIRRNLTCPLAAHKTLNYWSNLIARRAATEQNAIEAFLLDTRGYLAEGSCTNLFFVQGGRLCTPSLKTNILPGITRAHVMHLAGAADIDIRQGLYHPESLLSAEEAFLTNALMGILPIGRVNGRRIGRAAPGPVTKLLMKRYADSVHEHVRRFQSF